MANKIVRGQTLFVVVVFYDENSVIVIPDQATLRLAFTVGGARQTAEIAMADDVDGNFSATWDSSIADAGVLFWWAASNGSPKSAVEGRLLIEANPANPQT